MAKPNPHAHFWNTLDRFISAHWDTRSDFSRAAGILPESLSKGFSRMNLPKLETLDLMCDVLPMSEQQQLIDAFMTSGMGKRWEKLWGNAFAGAMSDTTLSREHVMLLQTDRATGGVLSALARSLDGVDPAAVEAVFSALMPQASRKKV